MSVSRNHLALIRYLIVYRKTYRKYGLESVGKELGQLKGNENSITAWELSTLLRQNFFYLKITYHAY